MFFLLTAVQKYKNQTIFFRVMITNVLPRFLTKHSVYCEASVYLYFVHVVGLVELFDCLWPPYVIGQAIYTVNQKKTWQYIFDYNFG